MMSDAAGPTAIDRRAEAGRAEQVRSHPIPPILRLAFLSMLVVWVLVPFAVRNIVAQDALAYISTGQIVRQHPDAIYAPSSNGHFTLSKEYTEKWCNLAPPGTDCRNLTTAFNWTPLTIPTSLIVGALGYDNGALVMRLAAALMLSFGMWCLWQRIAHRTRYAPHLLIASTILLLPVTLDPVVLGQSSPILFLSVCIGISRPKTRRTIYGAVAWAAASALKASPLAMGLVLVWRRRWRMLAWAAGVFALLALLSVVVASPSLWSDYFTSLFHFAGSVTHETQNRSIDSILLRVLHKTPGPTASIVTPLVMLCTAAAMGWFGMRRTSDDTRWAVGYTMLLMLSPLVWWHYMWLLIGALGVVIGEQRKLDDRTVAILPLVALALIPPNIPNVATSPWPVVQEIDFIVMMVLVVSLAHRSRQSGTVVDGLDEGRGISDERPTSKAPEHVHDALDTQANEG